jgi:glucose 1-dehydrogenase
LNSLAFARHRKYACARSNVRRSKPPAAKPKSRCHRGSSGIGEGCALNLGATGASVVINYYSDANKGGRVVATVRVAGSKAIAIQADVSKEAPSPVMFAETTGRFSEQSL